MRMVVLIGSDDSCFFVVVRLEDSPESSHCILPDLCTIIERAMYTVITRYGDKWFVWINGLFVAGICGS